MRHACITRALEERIKGETGAKGLNVMGGGEKNQAADSEAWAAAWAQYMPAGHVAAVEARAAGMSGPLSGGHSSWLSILQLGPILVPIEGAHLPAGDLAISELFNRLAMTRWDLFLPTGHLGDK